ncbi:angiopoietin-related protein 4 [Bombina bombina]|uniref:angiopoietin-related protein 4 n=1 Tax=Bombina bombina TaxID=8345 RepID=UPI00235B1F72|nr:angiopoietin-related protein 4 [Bombina bombina]
MTLLFSGLVLCASVLGAESWGSSSDKKVQFASWDEVNVIAHGLLQLGHGLKEHVDKTKGQLKDITGKLSHQNNSLVDLIKQAKEVRENGEALKGRVQELEGRDRQLYNLSEGLKGMVQEIVVGREQMDKKLQNMEDRILLLAPVPRNNLSDKHDDVINIQALMEAQNKRIDELLERIKLQQYKLDKQNLQIKSLQSKIQTNKLQSQKWRINARKMLSVNYKNQSIEDLKARLPSDCHQLFLRGENSSGIYTIQPLNAGPFEVFCEMTAEGGWTVIQKREDGSVDFDQLWEFYENGFGNLHGEFWLGLEKLYHITEQGQYRLRIELQDWEQNTQFMESQFILGGPSTAYALQLQGLVSGELENAMSDIRYLPFSTRDRDHDLKLDMNCAKHLSGGWWFSSCGHSNLNGKYFRSIPRQRHERKQGIFWKTWKGRYYPLKSTSLKIQPMDLQPTV